MTFGWSKMPFKQPSCTNTGRGCLKSAKLTILVQLRGRTLGPYTYLKYKPNLYVNLSYEDKKKV